MSEFRDKIVAIPIEDFAGRLGFHVERRGRMFTLEEHDSVAIDPDKNCFWRNSTGATGSIIDFAIELGGARTASEAMGLIAKTYGIGGKGDASIPQKARAAAGLPGRRGELEQREHGENNNRVRTYLTQQRGIDPVVVGYFLKHELLYQDKYGNCIFATKDFGCFRATNEETKYPKRGDLKNCDYDKCFFVKCSENAKTLVVTESVIDAMSYMTKKVRDGERFASCSYLALSGTPKLPALVLTLKGNPEIERVVLAFDNDAAGRAAEKDATLEVRSYFSGKEKGVCVSDFPARGKDWNDEILIDAKEHLAKSMNGYKKAIMHKKAQDAGKQEAEGQDKISENISR